MRAWTPHGPHRVVVRHALPAWTIRVLLVAVVAAAGAMMVPQAPWRIVAVAAALVAAAAPRTLAAYPAIGVLVVGLLQHDPSPAMTAAAVLAAHLIHVLSALAQTVPARARATWQALRPTAVRFALVQAAAQVVALIGMLPGGTAGGWLALAGGAALAAAASALALASRPARADLRIGRENPSNKDPHVGDHA